jgi:hypothetical protein
MQSERKSQGVAMTEVQSIELCASMNLRDVLQRSLSRALRGSLRRVLSLRTASSVDSAEEIVKPGKQSNAASVNGPSGFPYLSNGTL